MTDAVDFEATLWRPDARGTSTFITLPFDVKALFGRARCPVRVTVNDHTWRTTTQVYGAEYHVAINAEARASADVGVGDRIRVSVRKDDAVRSVDLPVELASALRGDPLAKEGFEALATSHRREYARWVGDAKLAPTRARRAAVAVERLKSGVRHPRSA